MAGVVSQFTAPRRSRGSIPAVPTTIAVLAAPTLAQEPPDTVHELGEIDVVVGSRAGIADPLALPVPVDVYGAEEISRLGEVDLAEVLGSVAPSFNSARLSAGDGGALHVATLGGMNGDQVLVLVNGRRRHPVAFAKVLAAVGQGTTGTDLGAIPVHAIKRIEVLREGAASQYGLDAIAGVINVVLKDDAGGITASCLRGRRQEDPAAAQRRTRLRVGSVLREHGSAHREVGRVLRLRWPLRAGGGVRRALPQGRSMFASGPSTRTRPASLNSGRHRRSWPWAVRSAAIPTGWRRAKGSRGPAARATGPGVFRPRITKTPTD